MLWKNRNDERPKAGLSPRETFLAAIAKAIGDAEDSGILDREIARILTARANEHEHRAAVRNYNLGGR
jgi:hypothetical protein